MRNDVKLIQSHVRDRYFVSTALRESSVIGDRSEYFETMVWDINNDGSRGRIIDQQDCGSSPHGAIEEHMEICLLLAELHDPPRLDKR